MASAEAVAAVVEAGGAHVPGLMRALEERLATIARSHGTTLGEHAGATIAAGGKRLRPLLVFVAAGPDAAGHDAALRAAVAVELVHSATLVHDDVLDAAVLRRGRPTVVASPGARSPPPPATCCSRARSRSWPAAGRVEPVRVLSDASSALVQGELLQREDAWRLETTRERYLRRCDLKTARLFRAACELGALAGGGNVPLLGEFGERIGLAFQLLDDVLDVSGPAERTGKHRGTDLLDGTVTLPLILARERDPELAQLDLRAVRTPEQAESVCDAIAATGALRPPAKRRWRWSPRRRRTFRRCPSRRSRRRWSWWPTASSTATARSLRQDRVGGRGRRRSARPRPPCSPARGGAGP